MIKSLIGLVVLVASAVSCGHGYRRCLSDLDAFRPPSVWDSGWSAPVGLELYDWRATVGLRLSNNDLPWVIRLESTEVWLSEQSLANILAGRLTVPGTEAIGVSRHNHREVRELRHSLETGEKTSLTHLYLGRILMTGEVAVRDLESGEFQSHVHILRLGIGCGGGTGDSGSQHYFLGSGRRFFSLGEWES